MALPCCGRSSAAPAARPRALAQDPQTLTSRTLPGLGAQGGGGSWRQTGALPQPPHGAGAAAGAAPRHSQRGRPGRAPPVPRSLEPEAALPGAELAAVVMGTEEHRGGGGGQAVALVLWVTFCQ